MHDCFFSLAESSLFREMARKYENYLDRNDPRMIRMLDAVRRANANQGDLREDDVVREHFALILAKNMTFVQVLNCESPYAKIIELRGVFFV